MAKKREEQWCNDQIEEEDGVGDKWCLKLNSMENIAFNTTIFEVVWHLHNYFKWWLVSDKWKVNNKCKLRLWAQTACTPNCHVI